MVTRRTVRIIVALAAIPVAILAWWLGSPLFLDRTVDEDFPHTARATIPDSMTQGEVEQLLAGLADRMDEVAEPMPAVALLRRSAAGGSRMLIASTAAPAAPRSIDWRMVTTSFDSKTSGLPTGPTYGCCSRVTPSRQVVPIWTLWAM